MRAEGSREEVGDMGKIICLLIQRVCLAINDEEFVHEQCAILFLHIDIKAEST